MINFKKVLKLAAYEVIAEEALELTSENVEEFVGIVEGCIKMVDVLECIADEICEDDGNDTKKLTIDSLLDAIINS